MSSALEQARYLDALAALYPGGVPLRLLREAAPSQADKLHILLMPEQAEAALILYDKMKVFKSDSPFRGAAGELLQDIVVKGMKLAGRTALFAFSADLEEALRDCPLARNVPLLLLGQEGAAESARNAPRGAVVEIEERKVMLTHALAQIGATPSAKKEFWADLKRYLEMLSV